MLYPQQHRKNKNRDELACFPLFYIQATKVEATLTSVQTELDEAKAAVAALLASESMALVFFYVFIYY